MQGMLEMYLEVPVCLHPSFFLQVDLDEFRIFHPSKASHSQVGGMGGLLGWCM